jgi:hypothetical protein
MFRGIGAGLLASAAHQALERANSAGRGGDHR